MHVQRKSLRAWAAAVISAALLELPFPLAGPLPVWRSVFAWFGLAPLFWAVLGCSAREGLQPERRRPLRRAFLLSYLCGALWYAGNCYWVYDTMLLHGGLPPAVSALLLAAFSLVLGLYFALFGLGIAWIRRLSGSITMALAAAPFFWTALDLAAARITSVPWDQLGYSQVDNALLTQLAPWTGVYGITFVLVASNALLAGGLLLDIGWRRRSLLAGLVVLAGGWAGLTLAPPEAATTATAVLVQPNLDVSEANNWAGAEWDGHIAEFARLAGEQCKSYIDGVPQTGAATVVPGCAAPQQHPDLVAWPESPAPYIEDDPRFQRAMASVATAVQAPVVVGGIGVDFSRQQGLIESYNSAIVISAQGERLGRYDKIHLVPYGEYIPYKELFFFARKLTGRVSEFSRGVDRKVFLLNGHRYGVFICYEVVFADEVRHFAQSGAEVLVNISDDGWYGDTSAPWQHLNMARMRAIENRRWILRDTNNGVTAAIDPYGKVRQSIPRHSVDALPAQYGFRDNETFYTAHGDVFAWACAILSLGVMVRAMRLGRRSLVLSKDRS